MGQVEQDCMDRTNRTAGLPAQGCNNQTAPARQKERTTEKTARTGQLGRTGRSIQPERDSQNRTSRTGQADRRDRTRLLAEHYQDSTVSVRYHSGGSMKLNARILHLAYMVYL
jgi:hypothetical protein